MRPRRCSRSLKRDLARARRPTALSLLPMTKHMFFALNRMKQKLVYKSKETTVASFARSLDVAHARLFTIVGTGALP